MTQKMIMDRIRRAKSEIERAERAEKAAQSRQKNWKDNLAEHVAALEEFRKSL